MHIQAWPTPHAHPQVDSTDSCCHTSRSMAHLTTNEISTERPSSAFCRSASTTHQTSPAPTPQQPQGAHHQAFHTKPTDGLPHHKSAGIASLSHSSTCDLQVGSLSHTICCWESWRSTSYVVSAIQHPHPQVRPSKARPGSVRLYSAIGCALEFTSRCGALQHSIQKIFVCYMVCLVLEFRSVGRWAGRLHQRG